MTTPDSLSPSAAPEIDMDKVLKRLAHGGGPFDFDDDVQIINWLANRELHRRASPLPDTPLNLLMDFESAINNQDEEATDAARTSLEDYFRTLQRENERLKAELSGVDQERSTARTKANAGTFLRAALSDHGDGPLTPEEMRLLAADLEDGLIAAEMQFSEPDWRWVDGLRASASALELAVDPSWSTPNEVDLASKVSALLSDNERLRAERFEAAKIISGCERCTIALQEARIDERLRSLSDETPK